VSETRYVQAQLNGDPSVDEESAAPKQKRPSYCRCTFKPRTTGRDWDIWVSDPNRAFCRACGKDVSAN
jgi:hypothetical protein